MASQLDIFGRTGGTRGVATGLPATVGIPAPASLAPTKSRGPHPPPKGT